MVASTRSTTRDDSYEAIDFEQSFRGEVRLGHIVCSDSAEVDRLEASVGKNGVRLGGEI